jgi:hypothetical protein
LKKQNKLLSIDFIKGDLLKFYMTYMKLISSVAFFVRFSIMFYLNQFQYENITFNGITFFGVLNSNAQDLVYKPKNPAFEIHFNYQWLLSSFETQND